jgi:hypothetical protein
MSDIDALANELQTIIDSVNWYNASAGNFKQTSLNRIEEIGIMLRPYFPHIAQLVQVCEEIRAQSNNYAKLSSEIDEKANESGT